MVGTSQDCRVDAAFSYPLGESLNNQVPASLYQPSSVRLARKFPEFTYPKGLLLRRVNNSGDIS